MTRFPFLAIALLSLVGVLGAGCRVGGGDEAEGPTTTLPVGTAPIAGSETTASGLAASGGESADIACYRSRTGDDAYAVFNPSDETAWARTLFRGPDGGGDLVLAEGRYLGDGNWLMLQVDESRTTEPTPDVWFLEAETLTTSSDEQIFERASCNSLQSPAINERTGAEPIDLALAEVVPVLAPGTYCFVDAGDRHSGDDAVELTVSAGGGVTAVLDSGSATGRFATDRIVVMNTERTSGGNLSVDWELWEIGPDGATLSFLPSRFVDEAAPCG